jgi:CRISPR-associated protein Cas6
MAAPSELVFVDVLFPLKGKSLPLDHGYALFGALSRLLPDLRTRRTWGIHPVFGSRSGPGTLELNERSSLKVRLPAVDIPAVLPLLGAELDVDGHRVVLGPPRIMPLVTAAALHARLVTIKGFHEEPAAFEAALRRQIAALEGLGQPPASVEVAVGSRRVMRAGDHTIVGFAVGLDGLHADASLAIQQKGLGGRRHMGAGLFVPFGRLVPA